MNWLSGDDSDTQSPRAALEATLAAFVRICSVRFGLASQSTLASQFQLNRLPTLAGGRDRQRSAAHCSKRDAEPFRKGFEMVSVLPYLNARAIDTVSPARGR